MRRTRQTLVAVAFTLVSCTTQIVPAATPVEQVNALRLYSTSTAAPLLYSLTTAYRQRHPEIVFDLTVSSYQALAERVLMEEGSYFLSHHLPEEIDTPQSRYWAAPVGQDALAIIVHPDNPLQNLTLEQLRAMYEGRVGSWESLGGDTRRLTVVTRDVASGVRAEFQSLVMGSREVGSAAQVVPTDLAMVETIASTPGGIGYVSLSALDARVRPLAINTILPDADSVYEQVYPLRMTVYVVGLAEPLDNDNPAMRAFIGWVQSPEGQRLVAEAYVPLLRP
jgi:phosphate transport system substrate-binding protein